MQSNRAITASIHWVSSRSSNSAGGGALRAGRYLVGPVKSALEWSEASEHRCWLDQLNMLMQAIWKTVAGGSDDALTTVRVNVDVILLGPLSISLEYTGDDNSYRVQHLLGEGNRDANSHPILCR